MQIIKYSTVKLLIAVMIGIIIIPFALELSGAERVKLRAAGWLFIVLGPMMVVGASRKLLGEGVALRYDNSSIYIEGLWKKRQARWSEVKIIGVNSINTYSAFRIFKTSLRYYYIEFSGSAFASTKVNIAPLFLSLEGKTLDDIWTDIQIRWLVETAEQNVHIHKNVPNSDKLLQSPQAQPVRNLTGSTVGFGRRGL